LLKHQFDLRCAATLCLVLCAVACTYPYVETGVPADIVSRNRPDEVQVGRKDRRLVVLLRPVVVRDSIHGHLVGDTREAVTSVALSDIEWAIVRGKRIAKTRTTILAVALAGVTLIVLDPPRTHQGFKICC
jgi:hypothetical protein